MRRLRCFCLCVTGFEKLCTRYRPRDSVIACRPCVIIVQRGTLTRMPPNIRDLASVLPMVMRHGDKLLHSPSLVAARLSVGYKVW